MAFRETWSRGPVRVFTLGGESAATSWGANCTAVSGRDATLVVDPLIAPAHAAMVGDALGRLGLPAVRWVVLTHHHTDHALGSSWFARRGAAVVAHEACGPGMAQSHPALIAERRRDPALAALFADAESVPPSVTFAGELTIDLGGVAARVFHPGHGHTPGDAVVHLPGESVVVCGDLVSNRYHVNFEDASLSGFEDGLGRILATRAAIFVPGHGEPGGAEIVESQRRYVGALRDLAAKSSGEADLVAAIRERFPSHLLGMVLPDTARVFARG